MSLRRELVLFLCVTAGVLTSIPSGTFAQNPAPAGPGATMPAEIKRVLAWLPQNTETLTVAQKFSLKNQEADRSFLNMAMAGQADLSGWTQWQVLEGLLSLDKGKYVTPLAGRQVIAAVRGSRTYDVVSSFGSLRSEGCAIVIFEKDLDGAAAQWTTLLRAGAKAVKQVSDREVFVFDSQTAMEPWVKPKPWQGTFLVLLNSSTILCATSDKYLAEVLQNIDAPPAKRALPDKLPEWQHVDFAAPGWMLRHVPDQVAERTFSGVTLVTSKQRLRLIYVPLPMKETEALDLIRSKWTYPNQSKIHPAFHIQQLKERVVEMTTGNNAFQDEHVLANAVRLWQVAGDK